MSDRRGSRAVSRAVALGIVMLLVIMLSVVGRAVYRKHQRDQQVITEGTLTSLANAIDAFHADHGHYPQRSGTIDGIARFIGVYYEAVVPLNDAWGYVFRYQSDGGDYALWSVGSDGQTDRAWPGGEIVDSARDIVVKNGRRWQYPVGTAENFAELPPARPCASCHRRSSSR